MLSKENQQKLTCLAGHCDHDFYDTSCLLYKYVDADPKALHRIFEKIVEDEIKTRSLKDSKKKGKTSNGKKSKSLRK